MEADIRKAEYGKVCHAEITGTDKQVRGAADIRPLYHAQHLSGAEHGNPDDGAADEHSVTRSIRPDLLFL